MTIRQILAALWRRKWIIVAVTVLAGVVAAGYLYRLTPDYESSMTVRFSPTISAAATSGQLGGLPATVDPSIITSPEVLDPAAEALGEPKGALYGTVTYEVPQTLTTTTASTLLTITVSGSSPEQAQARANAVVKSLGEDLDGVVEDTLKELEKRAADVGKQATDYRKTLNRNPNDPVAQANLTTATANLSALTTQMSSLDLAGPSVTVTAPALPGASTNPSLTVVVGLALLCGLLAGAGVALVRDHFDDRLRDEDDLEDLTGVATLGTLANDHLVARKRDRLPTSTNRRTALSEGIRSLRTSIQVLLPEGRGVVVITSVEPGDGKTFTSANLAVSWARAGRRVVLVGGDMRRPEIDAYFKASDDGPGLGGLLTDAAETKNGPANSDIAAALNPTRIRGLRILPPGDTHDLDEPADLLAGRALPQIIRYLAKIADIVVIDTPPALAMADVSELAWHADGTVLMTAVGRTRKAHVVEAIDTLQANDVTLLGTVMNRSRKRLPKSYGSYYVRHPQRPARGAGSGADVGADPDETNVPQTPEDVATEREDAIVAEETTERSISQESPAHEHHGSQLRSRTTQPQATGVPTDDAIDEEQPEAGDAGLEDDIEPVDERGEAPRRS